MSNSPTRLTLVIHQIKVELIYKNYDFYLSLYEVAEKVPLTVEGDGYLQIWRHQLKQGKHLIFAQSQPYI